MFSEKNGQGSVFLFNRENWDYGQIKQTIFGWWFFVTNKLIILYWVPLDTEKSNTIKAEEIEKLAEDIMSYSLPKEVLLICVSYKPDKRGRFYKWIDKLDKENPWNKIIKYFEPLKDFELSNFVKQEAKDLDLDLKAIETLVGKVWNNQFRLESEIDKLRYWRKYYEKNITSDVIDDICFWMIEEDVFKLLDLVLTDINEAILFIRWLQDDWLDWNAINWSFIWWLRNYLLILDYIEHWITDSKKIAVDIKQNPWIVSNILKKSNILIEKKEYIKNLFRKVVDIDYDIKNGRALPGDYLFVIKKYLLQN